MNQDTLQELFAEQIRDLYDAEKQIVKALPKMVKAANSEELSEALSKHLDETQNQVTRLEGVFRMLGVPAKGKTCKGMKGLLEEGAEAVQEEDDETLLDLAIIAAAQKVEHYEISGYGTAKAIADRLGRKDAVKLLEQTEDEEAAADSTLTKIAMSLYEAADSGGMGEEEGEEAVDAETGKSAAKARGNSASSSRGTAKRARQATSS